MAHPMSVATAETLTGTRTLTLAEVQQYAFWSFDPGGAGRNLVMPSEVAAARQIVFVHNSADAAEVITVKASDGTTTICTPTQAETAVLWCDGTTWVGLVGANS